MEILDVKSTMNKMKNSQERKKKKISKLEDRSIEIVSLRDRKKKNN